MSLPIMLSSLQEFRFCFCYTFTFSLSFLLSRMKFPSNSPIIYSPYTPSIHPSYPYMQIPSHRLLHVGQFLLSSILFSFHCRFFFPPYKRSLFYSATLALFVVAPNCRMLGARQVLHLRKKNYELYRFTLEHPATLPAIPVILILIRTKLLDINWRCHT